MSNQWNPASQPPDGPRSVLVSCTRKERPDIRRYAIAFYAGIGETWIFENGFPASTVTHWQELPPPPTE